MLMNFFEFIFFEIIYSSAYIIILNLISRFITKKFGYDDSTQYFILHFIHNMIITTIVAPYCFTMLSDPVGVDNDYIEYKSNYEYLFPMISGLHTFHILKSYKKIQWDATSCIKVDIS